MKTSEKLWFSDVFRGYEDIGDMKWVKANFAADDNRKSHG